MNHQMNPPPYGNLPQSYSRRSGLRPSTVISPSNTAPQIQPDSFFDSGSPPLSGSPTGWQSRGLPNSYSSERRPESETEIEDYESLDGDELDRENRFEMQEAIFQLREITDLLQHDPRHDELLERLDKLERDVLSTMVVTSMVKTNRLNSSKPKMSSDLVTKPWFREVMAKALTDTRDSIVSGVHSSMVDILDKVRSLEDMRNINARLSEEISTQIKNIGTNLIRQVELSLQNFSTNSLNPDLFRSEMRMMQEKLISLEGKIQPPINHDSLNQNISSIVADQLKPLQSEISRTHSSIAQLNESISNLTNQINHSSLDIKEIKELSHKSAQPTPLKTEPHHWKETADAGDLNRKVRSIEGARTGCFAKQSTQRGDTTDDSELIVFGSPPCGTNAGNSIKSSDHPEVRPAIEHSQTTDSPIPGTKPVMIRSTDRPTNAIDGDQPSNSRIIKSPTQSTIRSPIRSVIRSPTQPIIKSPSRSTIKSPTQAPVARPLLVKTNTRKSGGVRRANQQVRGDPVGLNTVVPVRAKSSKNINQKDSNSISSGPRLISTRGTSSLSALLSKAPGPSTEGASDLATYVGNLEVRSTFGARTGCSAVQSISRQRRDSTNTRSGEISDMSRDIPQTVHPQVSPQRSPEFYQANSPSPYPPRRSPPVEPGRPIESETFYQTKSPSPSPPRRSPPVEPDRPIESETFHQTKSPSPSPPRKLPPTESETSRQANSPSPSPPRRSHRTKSPSPSRRSPPVEPGRPIESETFHQTKSPSSPRKSHRTRSPRRSRRTRPSSPSRRSTPSESHSPRRSHQARSPSPSRRSQPTESDRPITKKLPTRPSERSDTNNRRKNRHKPRRVPSNRAKVPIDELLMDDILSEDI